MSIFKRLFNIGAAEAHSALDKLEDPVKMTEQGIRDLKDNLNKSMHGLAEVKAIAIRTRKDMEAARAEASEYEQKAMLLLQRAESGQIDPAEADRLATEALTRKGQADERATTNAKMLQTQEAQVAQMTQNVQKLKSQISSWENEAKTLKARAKVSQATAKLNKHLANVDSTGTVAMLEKMKDKVNQQEALAESYGEMADSNKSLDDEITQALGPSASASESLAALKAKLALNKNNPE